MKRESKTKARRNKANRYVNELVPDIAPATWAVLAIFIPN